MRKHWARGRAAGLAGFTMRALRADGRLAPLSRGKPLGRGRWVKGVSTWRGSEPGCRQRVLFLYLVLATEAELADAAAEQRWMAGLSERERRRYAGVTAALEARYGLLFEPRCLFCRQCLGLRYGNHPETVRRYYQRMVRPRRALERARAREALALAAEAEVEVEQGNRI